MTDAKILTKLRRSSTSLANLKKSVSVYRPYDLQDRRRHPEPPEGIQQRLCVDGIKGLAPVEGH